MLDLRRSIIGLLASACALGQQPIPTSPTPTSSLKKVDTIVIELTPYGFVPAQVTHTSSQHFLFVRNRTGLPNLNLTIANSVAATVVAASVTQASPHFRQLMSFSVGSYVLTEANHPGWSAKITITAQ